MSELSRLEALSPEKPSVAPLPVEPPGANQKASPGTPTPLADALLLIHADALDDLERVRIATENRARSLQQVKGMEGTPEEERMDKLTEGLRALEHQAQLDLQRAMKNHPLGPFIKSQVGIGMKQGARLLAAIGDPAARSNVAKLWAYCGFHVVNGQAPKRRRGEQGNWNTVARSRAWLVAESCIKHRHSPYRTVYDEGRKKYEDRDLTDGHKHAMAMRLVAKEILKQLWIAARDINQLEKETLPQ